MKATITMSSKGQFTLPAEIRTKLHLKEGDSLAIVFNESLKQVTISKPISLRELQAYMQAKDDHHIDVPENIHAWYEQTRSETLTNQSNS